MDKEAWDLTCRWHIQKVKNFYSDQWCDLKDALEELLKLFMITLRIVLSPFAWILILAVELRCYYKQLKTYDKESRERVRKHIERSEKN
ncbi:hypothetical protein F909_04080 [Acinetobacter sp. ANC 3929]|nr:hypothetical protein F909_04080 [Acinetobacter sp. ANC 3929]